MFKTIFIVVISIVVVFIVVMIGRTNWGWFGANTNSSRTSLPEGVFTSNGSPANSSSKQMCNPACLEAYPVGSQYAGYYFCKKNCSSAVFIRGNEIETPSTPVPLPPKPPVAS